MDSTVEAIIERAFATPVAANPDVSVWLVLTSLALGTESPTSRKRLTDLPVRVGVMGERERAALVEALVAAGGDHSRAVLAELLTVDLPVKFELGGVGVSGTLSTLAAHALARFGDRRGGETLLAALSKDRGDDAFIGAHGLATLPADRKRQDAVAKDDGYEYPVRLLCAVASLRMGSAEAFVSVVGVDEGDAFSGHAWVEPRVRELHLEMLPPLAQSHVRTVRNRLDPDSPLQLIQEVLHHLRAGRTPLAGPLDVAREETSVDQDAVDLANEWITKLNDGEAPDRLNDLRAEDGDRLARDAHRLDHQTAAALATAVAAVTALRQSPRDPEWDHWLFGDFLPAVAPVAVDTARLAALANETNLAQLAWVLSRGQLDSVLETLLSRLEIASTDAAVLNARMMATVAAAAMSNEPPVWGHSFSTRLAVPPASAATDPETPVRPAPPAPVWSRATRPASNPGFDAFQPADDPTPGRATTRSGRRRASAPDVSDGVDTHLDPYPRDPDVHREAEADETAESVDNVVDEVDCEAVTVSSDGGEVIVSGGGVRGEVIVSGGGVGGEVIVSGGGDPLSRRRARVRIQRAGRNRQTVAAEAPNRLKCWIGPGSVKGPGVAPKPIHEPTEIPADGLPLEVFLEGVNERKHTRLYPAPARTKPVTFEFIGPPLNDGFARRLTFLLNGAILESVTVSATVIAVDTDDEPGQTVDVRVDVDLRGRAALTTREPRASAVLGLDDSSEIVVFGPAGAQGAKVDLDLPAVTEAFAVQLFGAVTSLVRSAENEGEDHRALDVKDETTRALLVSLAQNGATLHRELAQQDFGAPAEVVQVVSLNDRRYLPLELVYDRGFPDDDATINPACIAALRTDAQQCPHCKPTAELSLSERDCSPTVCPFGWWSMIRRFERLLLTRPKLDQVLLGHELPREGNSRLSAVTSALAGISGQVRDKDRDAFREDLDDVINTSFVDSWAAWREHVRKHAPPMLVALAHQLVDNSLERLEIGGTDPTLATGQPLELYVNARGAAPGPVVILLGCESDGATTLGYQSFARSFAHSGASVVVGTLSKVLGRHAAPVTVELVRRLANAPPGVPFSRVLLDCRRTMFADGYLMALAVIALGDADWMTA